MEVRLYTRWLPTSPERAVEALPELASVIAEHPWPDHSLMAEESVLGWRGLRCECSGVLWRRGT